MKEENTFFIFRPAFRCFQQLKAVEILFWSLSTLLLILDVFSNILSKGKKKVWKTVLKASWHLHVIYFHSNLHTHQPLDSIVAIQYFWFFFQDMSFAQILRINFIAFICFLTSVKLSLNFLGISLLGWNKCQSKSNTSDQNQCNYLGEDKRKSTCLFWFMVLTIDEVFYRMLYVLTGCDTYFE